MGGVPCEGFGSSIYEGSESVSGGTPSVTVERVPPHGSVSVLRLAEADLDVRGEMFVTG